MKKIFASLLCLISAPASAESWSILNNLVPLYYNAQRQPYFTFNQTVPYHKGVNYLTADVMWLFNKPKGLSITYRIDTTALPAFDWRTNPNNTCAGTTANARLMIWRNGPYDLSTQTYRYWSRIGFANLTPGTVTIRADFDPAQWSDVYGQTGAQNPAAFAQAIQFANRAGITFGGGCFYGHGVFVDRGTGTAKLTVTNFGTY